MHWAIEHGAELVNHAVITTGHATRTKAQLGTPGAAQFWTLHCQTNRLLSQAKRAGRQAYIELGRSSCKTFIGIDLAFGNVSNHHVTWQPIHPSELPKNGNHGLAGIKPLTLEDVPHVGTELVVLKGQDGVERQGHRYALTEWLPATRC